MARHPPCRSLAIHHVAWLAAAVLFAVGTGANLDAARCVLIEVGVSKVPRVENGRMTYTLDLVFDRAPRDFWTYYDPRTSGIIIDLYGDTVENTVLTIPRNLVFKNVRVRNMATDMALSGLRSQLNVGVDPGWEPAVDARGRDTLRLTVSRMVSVQASRAKVARRWGPYLFTTAVAGLASAVVLVALNRSNP